MSHPTDLIIGGATAMGCDDKGHIVWKVGVVQPKFEGMDGFGFVITDDQSRPVAEFFFETRADAEAAATHAQEVVKNAKAVRGLNVS